MKVFSASSEKENRALLLDSFCTTPIPNEELINNLMLFMRTIHYRDILAMNFFYEKILPTTGVIIELGCRWGQRLSQLISLRSIYEPSNFSRKIIGFDTFSGFPKVSPEDGKHHRIKEGTFNVTPNYIDYLAKVLKLQENENPINHIDKFELIGGDVTITVENYFKHNPETIVAFVYFDLDLFEPTKKCLEILKSHTHKGTLFAFDELSHPNFPGEALAVKQVLELSNIQILKCPFNNAAFIRMSED